MTSINKNNQLIIIDESTETHNWWFKECFHSWEPITFMIFDKYLNQSNYLIDIGAWIGTTCLYGSKISKGVYAIEADPHSIIDLKKNIIINGAVNIRLCEEPIFNKKTQIYFGPYETDWNTSSSHIRIEKKDDKDQLMATTTYRAFLDEYQIRDVGLVKVDIEGGEEHIINDLFDETIKMRPKPPIYLSFHISWWQDKNIERFQNNWSNYKYIYHDDLIIPIECVNSFLEENPMAALLFTDQLFAIDH